MPYREVDIQTYWRHAMKMGRDTLAADPHSLGYTHEYFIWLQSTHWGVSIPLPRRVRGVFDEEATSRILLRQLMNRFTQAEEAHAAERVGVRATLQLLRSQLAGLVENMGQHFEYLTRVSLPDAGAHSRILIPSFEVSLQGIIQSLDSTGLTWPSGSSSDPSQPRPSHSGAA
uniref:Uncharacterized protein LOC104234700 isoform X1 n=2 Tax=Nicotiana sylvestris TaxID=4096 RepID=A0A1U7XAC9_NICSY|nr:PREDICTED: uncharacterized protein LOC104234700 isoform X1 [Nicotiana sylvestris]